MSADVRIQSFGRAVEDLLERDQLQKAKQVASREKDSVTLFFASLGRVFTGTADPVERNRLLNREIEHLKSSICKGVKDELLREVVIKKGRAIVEKYNSQEPSGLNAGIDLSYKAEMELTQEATVGKFVLLGAGVVTAASISARTWGVK